MPSVICSVQLTIYLIALIEFLRTILAYIDAIELETLYPTLGSVEEGHVRADLKVLLPLLQLT
jgi:hypothetical protein